MNDSCIDQVFCRMYYMLMRIGKLLRIVFKSCVKMLFMLYELLTCVVKVFV